MSQIYRCLSCTRIFDPAHLWMCNEPHLNPFGAAVMVGPLCKDCLAAHELCAHPEEERPQYLH